MILVRAHGEELHLSMEEFEARVRAGRIREDAEIRFEPVTGEDWVRAGELELFRDLALDPVRRGVTRLDDLAPPILTAVLLGLNIRVWWLGNALDGGARTSVWLTDWLPPILVDGEVWRLISMGFAHTALGHIALNMLWFALSAALLERVLGRLNLLAIYLGSVLTGALASAWFAPLTPSLGASGGVFGLIGALVVFGMRHDELLTRRQRQFFGWTMVPYVAYMLYSGTQSANTDNWAHFFGFFGGVAICFALSPHAPAHNRRVHVGLAASSVLVLAVMGLFGPRIYPLWDAAEASRALMQLSNPDLPEVERQPTPLSYRVPAGWRGGTSPTGMPGFVSPSPRRGETLGLAVQEREHDTVQTPHGRYEELVDTVARAWPSAEVPEPEPRTLAGYEGLGLRVQLGDQVLHWAVATRGVQVLEAQWWVDPGREASVEVLRERVLEHIAWADPPELADARRAVEDTPGPSSRRRLASELARIGEFEEAVALLDVVLGDDDAAGAARSAAWVTRVEIALAGGPPVDVDAALAAAQPEVVVALVPLLAEAPDLRGLLDLAGRRWPAHKGLRKARLREGLPARRDRDTGLPWHVVWQVDGTLRPEAEREDLLAAPLTREAAVEATAWLEALDARAVQLALDEPRERLDALCFLKFRYIPDKREAARDQLMRDVARAAEGRAPSWMPTAIVQAAADPAFRTALQRD